MSPILINSTSTVTPKSNLSNNNNDEEKGEEETEKAREERKQTGRSIAIIIFLSLMCLALYHVIQRKTTILAGVLVPALILFAYTFFVIHISNRDKKRRKKLEANELHLLSEQNKLALEKSASPTPPLSAVPSTSGKLVPLPKVASKLKQVDAAANIHAAKAASNGVSQKINASTGVKKKAPLKKIPSQSHIQVKSNQSAHIAIENEIKKLKKSRSFDRNNHLESRHLVVDNKKIKTKH